jgi:hypothetical protein
LREDLIGAALNDNYAVRPRFNGYFAFGVILLANTRHGDIMAKQESFRRPF